MLLSIIWGRNLKSEKSIFLSLALSMLIHGLALFSISKSDQLRVQKINFSKIQSDQTESRMTMYIQSENVIRKKHSQGLRPQQKKTKKLLDKKIKKVGKVKKVKDQGRNDLYAKYLNEIRSLIQKGTKYPRVAKKLKMQGKVKISFEIEWPNKIKNLNIVDKSDYELLNKSALSIVEEMNDIPTIPNELNMKMVKVVIPVVYELL